MILVGIDLEATRRFARLRPAVRGAVYRRLFTREEEQAFDADHTRSALCFASKEALAKVLGTGLGIGQGPEVSCLDIEIRGLTSTAALKPRVILRGQARAIAEDLGLARLILAWLWGDGTVCAIAAGATAEIPAAELRRHLGRCARTIGPVLGIPRADRPRGVAVLIGGGPGQSDRDAAAQPRCDNVSGTRSEKYLLGK